MKKLALILLAFVLSFGFSQTIVDIAAGDETFSTLVTAVTEAGLVETLSGEGPFTVFAPTNEAFAKLPEGTLEMLLADVDLLTEVLTYHVVAGQVMAADVVGLSSARTVEGGVLNINVDGSTVMVNDATVTATDIEASNGVIHVIDSVIVPPLLGLPKAGAVRLPVSVASDSGVSGTVVIKGNRTSSTISILLQGTPQGAVHPAHFHAGNCGSGGDVVVPLNSIDGTTGISRTIVDVPYGVIMGNDHYLNIHLSPDDMGTIAACGEVGTGAMAQ